MVATALAFLVSGAQAANWEQPANGLARQIAALSGPGPVLLTVRNRSNLSPGEIPAIRRLLERDLRAFGVIAAGNGSPTVVRVTLSQNVQGGLWVAEVQEGTETRVTMLPVRLDVAAASPGSPNLTLRRTILLTEPDPVLDAQIVSVPGEQRLLVLEPAQLLVYARSMNALTPAGTAPTASGPWTLTQTLSIPWDRAQPRDMRGRIVAAQGHLFDAYLPGMECRGANDGPQIAMLCSDSDNPWPVTATQSAFYDSARDYFTGVLAPGFSMDLPPIYEAAAVPRPAGSATLLDNVDGAATLIDNNRLEPVNGADDWGSDLAAVHSACGLGTQIVVSGSGAGAAGDTLRAWQIPGREAIPVSAPLQVPGTVMAIWPSLDGDHAIAIVRQPVSAGTEAEYEVWNVTPSCD